MLFFTFDSKTYQMFFFSIQFYYLDFLLFPAWAKYFFFMFFVFIVPQYVIEAYIPTHTDSC